MQLKAIIMTRVIGIVPRGQTDPFGKIFLPDILPHLIERYRFQRYPSVSEINPSEGTILELGFAKECGTISKLTAYNDGLNIETRAHSMDAKAALISIYEWLAREHGLAYNDRMVRRWLYVTDLTFQSELDLTELNPVLQPICDAMSEYNSEIGRKDIQFRASRIAIDYDHSIVDFPQTPFLIERDKSASFSEGLYFSESPFPSERHLEILEQVERGMLKVGD